MIRRSYWFLNVSRLVEKFLNFLHDSMINAVSSANLRLDILYLRNVILPSLSSSKICHNNFQLTCPKPLYIFRTELAVSSFISKAQSISTYRLPQMVTCYWLDWKCVELLVSYWLLSKSQLITEIIRDWQLRTYTTAKVIIAPRKINRSSLFRSVSPQFAFEIPAIRMSQRANFRSRMSNLLVYNSSSSIPSNLHMFSQSQISTWSAVVYSQAPSH